MTAPTSYLPNSIHDSPGIKVADPDVMEGGNINIVLTSNEGTTRDTASTTSIVSTRSREKPRCSKCKRPRAGHPRSGCPFVNLDQPTLTNMDSPYNVTLDSQGHGGHDMGPMALKSNKTLELGAEANDDNGKKTFSPAPTSKAAMGQLSQPSDFDNSDSISSNIRVKHPQVKGTKDTKGKLPVPASSTVSLPCKPSTQSNINELSPKQELLPTSLTRSIHEQHSKPDEPGENADALKSNLVTTNTMERDLFISKLSGQALAAIFLIPKVHTNAILNQAAALELKAELIVNKSFDDHDPNVLIILGGHHTDHEEIALRRYLSTLTVTTSSDHEVKLRGPSMFQATAAAMVVGSIGACVALAFI